MIRCMDGREGIALPGSIPYYLHRGVSGYNNSLHGYRNVLNPNVPFQSIIRGHDPAGSSFDVEESGRGDIQQGFGVSMASSSVPARKKRGRPRKYGPDGAGASGSSTMAEVSLELSPMLSPYLGTVVKKRKRGRPPGSGRKQRLSLVGEWMSSSAGLAFTPHVIHISPGEDIAGKILLFSQQRPRAICIMSASGGVCSVTLCQPGNCDETFAYEGCFEILCLSGSFLVDDNSGGSGRIGGVTVSLSSADGLVIGGTVGGKLIASRHAQVVVCSFVYGSAKAKMEAESNSKSGKRSRAKQSDSLPAPDNSSPVKNFVPATGMWPSSGAMDHKVPHAAIDLMRG